MEKDDILEPSDSDEFSEIHSISSSDSDTPQPPPKTPKTPKTLKTPNHRKDGLKRFWHEGDEFIEVKNLAKPVHTAKRKKTSPIWKLGREVKRIKDERTYWHCSICKKEGVMTILSCRATSGPIRHLESHGYSKYKGRLVYLRKKQNYSKDIPAKDHKGQGIRFGSFLLMSTADQFRALFLQWIICSHIALCMVENPLFRKLIEFINQLFIQLLPLSANTLRQWVIEEHKCQKTMKKRILHKARSRITISFDTWTSPFSKKHVLSVIAHFVDENWERRHLQLSMCRLYGGHGGENLAHHIVPILQDWGIASRLGYVVTDNEPANGTGIDHILEVLEPEIYQSIKTKKAKRAELRKRWIRCLAHSLNLISQAFLFGKNPEEFIMKTDGVELTGHLEELERLWRTRSFIGKLSNIIRYIRRSPKQRAEFERIRVNDDTGDVYWIAVEEVEDDEQLEVCKLQSKATQIELILIYEACCK
jgi:succinate dehydrogenase flavin-adding protein (antitoxin of CptAB toxin-antitoxin module)